MGLDPHAPIHQVGPHAPAPGLCWAGLPLLLLLPHLVPLGPSAVAAPRVHPVHAVLRALHRKGELGVERRVSGARDYNSMQA